MNYVFLLIAIFCEITATSFLKSSVGFTKPIPTTISLIGFGLAMYFLSLAVRTIPIGIAYAIWCGIGIVVTILLAWFIYSQKPDLWAIIGIIFVIIGILIINIFSKMSA